MARKGYLTEAQAVGLINGGSNAEGDRTRTAVQVYTSGWPRASAMVYIEDGDFCGWLATARKPSEARNFRTLDAAVRAAMQLIAEGCPKLKTLPPKEAVFSVEVIADRSYSEGKA